MAQDLVLHIGANTDNFNASIESARKSITEFGKKAEDELADLSTRFKNTAGNAAPLGRKLSDLRKQMQALATSEYAQTTEGKALYDQMAKAAQQYDRQLQQIRNDSRAAADAHTLASKVTEIKKQMEELIVTDKINTKEGQAMWKKLAEEAKKYKDGVDEVNDAVNSGGKSLDFKGMGKDIADKFGLGGAFDGITKLMSGTTGLYTAGAAGAALAAKALYDYNVELDRSLKRTEQFTGLSGNELNSLRNGIKSVADTFGKDYDTVLSSVDGMMAQFGMDAETALDIIRDGFVSGADDGGRMLDLISQYSGSFKDAGISASELVAIIGNTRSGIFNEEGMALIQKAGQNIRLMSDKTAQALDAIGMSYEEMTKKLADGSLSTVNAMKQISSKLKELNPQSQEVGEVLKTVFGKQGAAAGMELVTALADVEDNLEVVKQQSGEWGEAMEKVQEADRNLENALQTMFGVANGGFAEMGQLLKGEIYQACADVINYFVELYNQSMLIRGAVQLIGVAFKSAWDIIKSILQLLATEIKAVAEMTEGLFTLDWKKVANGWANGMKSIFTEVQKVTKNIGKDVMDGIDNTVNHKIETVTTNTTKTGEVSIDNSNKKTPVGTPKANAEGSKSKSSKTKTEKTEKIDYLVSVDDNTLDTAEKKLQAWASKKKTLNIDDKEAIEKCDIEINKWTEEVKKRKLILETDVVEEGSKEYLEKQIKELEEKKKVLFKVQANPDDIKKIDDEIDALKVKLESEEIRLGIKPEIAPGSINDIRKRISEKQKEIDLALNTNIDAESMRKLQAELDALRKEEKDKSIEIGVIKNTATVSKNEESWYRGSVEDKRQSLSNAQSMVSEIQENYKLKLIGKDEALAGIAKINEGLESIGLKPIEITVNDDGTLTTAAENLERYKEKMDGVASITSSVGSTFSSLGSAIGGTTGQIMSFAGQSVSAIAKVIPEIVTMITAKQAEAIASGTAGAMGAGFPACIPALAAVLAAIAGIFASLPKFESGGIVGGSSFTGDKLLARVNSGEMILNKRQQNNLYNSMAAAEVGAPMQNTLKGDVTFSISGAALKGTLRNYDSKMSKIK